MSFFFKDETGFEMDLLIQNGLRVASKMRLDLENALILP